MGLFLLSVTWTLLCRVLLGLVIVVLIGVTLVLLLLSGGVTISVTLFPILL